VGVKVKRFSTNIYLYRASGYYEKNTFEHYLKAHLRLLLLQPLKDKQF
jgi:hypothetical protein